MDELLKKFPARPASVSVIDDNGVIKVLAVEARRAGQRLLLPDHPITITPMRALELAGELISAARPKLRSRVRRKLEQAPALAAVNPGFQEYLRLLGETKPLVAARLVKATQRKQHADPT
jgi:hypothetical protein